MLKGGSICRSVTLPAAKNDHSVWVPCARNKKSALFRLKSRKKEDVRVEIAFNRKGRRRESERANHTRLKLRDHSTNVKLPVQDF
jgi:hypothetical protein